MRSMFIYLGIIAAICLAGLVLHVSPRDVQGKLFVLFMFMATGGIMWKVCRGSA